MVELLLCGGPRSQRAQIIIPSTINSTKAMPLISPNRFPPKLAKARRSVAGGARCLHLPRSHLANEKFTLLKRVPLYNRAAPQRARPRSSVPPSPDAPDEVGADILQ